MRRLCLIYELSLNGYILCIYYGGGGRVGELPLRKKINKEDLG